MTDQIDIEELIEEKNQVGDVISFKTNIPPKWNTSFDDNGYKQLPNGTEFIHNDVTNNKLFADVGTVEPVPLFVDKPFGVGIGTMQKLETVEQMIIKEIHKNNI